VAPPAGARDTSPDTTLALARTFQVRAAGDPVVMLGHGASPTAPQFPVNHLGESARGGPVRHQAAEALAVPCDDLVQSLDGPVRAQRPRRPREWPGRGQAAQRLEGGCAGREQPTVREYQSDRRETLVLGKRVEQWIGLFVFQPEERELPRAVEPSGEPRRAAAEPSAGVVKEDRAGDDVAHDPVGTFAP
jgi:hypothetical protein